jgi:hypothetical protein
LVYRYRVGCRIEFNEQIACLHNLIIENVNLGDSAVDLWRDLDKV